MYLQFQKRLAERVRDFLREKYQLELATMVVEQPPSTQFGEYALPLSFELAKRLRKPPRKIAEEIVTGLGEVPGFEKLEVAGAGYINARVNRGELAAMLASGSAPTPEIPGKILVEHTSINPNKAAHIGHLRNAILGDTFVRLLRAHGRLVDVQNYIDNTGVQVADVVVGFIHLEKKSRAEIERLIASDPRFDYTCWDLYARVTQWYQENDANLKVRLDSLHAIEQGGNELAAIADAISTTVLRRHLETMQRLDIEYDFLPRESEILHLHFWNLAFQQMKDKGVLYLETEGKNQGCWVMERGGLDKRKAEALEEAEQNQKVIVRSNGTVTYVGKDIAYHLWKFGLLGRDFGYQRFYHYPSGRACWISAEQGEADHPHFGDVAEIYNVIDSRQQDAQNNVIEALRALGATEQADHYTHFCYDMVALTPRCAQELGYELAEDDWVKPYIEISGRRGFGVKADDLIDTLIASAQKEVDSRHPGLDKAERTHIATEIAVGALRYFMLKFTKNSVIAFDFREALSFEGETGPYAQYAVVRATNIFRKAGVEPEAALAESIDYASFFSGDVGDEIWELWLTASRFTQVIEQCIGTTEPAHMAKYAFQLAQVFNNFYHRHHILTEPDEGRKKFLLATAAVVRRELIRALAVMGITVPPVM
ncbi:MAG TPA: arginine--tRNA ligase [Terriglobales bacterium]|nr:arginine--tRNA ligase [Terriglobales bacterium]